ncbi:RNA demethylase ALKBH9B-like [Ipomoea triloba]|uniref:RNA demethylase ALKBH9B-like n=1 Tax=Ipomoea triloba TaxID=35885 RepID=UPI00125D9078|nr:RNA demethylase ALKBH9B-like [Ipomoea triloba]
MDKLNIQFGEISFSCLSEIATVLHAPIVAPTYLNPLKKLVSDASSPATVNRKQTPTSSSWVKDKGSLSDDEEKKEHMRFAQVNRKKDFVHYERVNGEMVNVVEGVELHTGVFDAEKQMKIVECVYKYQQLGRKGQLRARTYYEPKKRMGRKGRTIIQFGGCYNYAVDKNGNPPGIIRDEEVDPLPAVFKQMIKRMVRWHILPPTAIPNSCIVNIYEEGDCIPPHIDHHDFIRPFCSVSFLSECNIVFGSSLKIVNHGIGEFFGPVSVPLPVGSVLVLQGNGADVAKHCVPRVPSKRISLTFRRMDESKLPYNYKPDPELMRIQPIILRSPQFKESSTPQRVGTNEKVNHDKPRSFLAYATNQNILAANEEFPPLSKASVFQARTRLRTWPLPTTLLSPSIGVLDMLLQLNNILGSNIEKLTH